MISVLISVDKCFERVREICYSSPLQQHLSPLLPVVRVEMGEEFLLEIFSFQLHPPDQPSVQNPTKTLTFSLLIVRCSAEDEDESLIESANLRARHHEEMKRATGSSQLDHQSAKLTHC